MTVSMKIKQRLLLLEAVPGRGIRDVKGGRYIFNNTLRNILNGDTSFTFEKRDLETISRTSKLNGVTEVNGKTVTPTEVVIKQTNDRSINVRIMADGVEIDALTCDIFFDTLMLKSECILSDTKNHYKERFVNEATAFLRKFMRHLKELEKKTCKH